MLSLGVLHSINSFLIISGSFIIMFSISPKITLLTLIPIPIILFLIYKQSKLMMKITRQQQNNLGELSRVHGEQLNAYNLIHQSKILKKIKYKTSKYNQFYLKISKKLVLTRTMTSLTLNSIIIIASLIILFFGGQKVISGEMTYGSLISFLIYFNYMRGPLRAISFLLPLAQRGEASLERIFTVIDKVENALNIEGKKQFQDYKSIIKKQKNQKSSIYIEKIKFQYKKQEKFTLDIEDITIDSNKTYGIFGPIASGKTTLIKLITAQIQAPEHKIYINAIPYQEIAEKELRMLFSFVFQNNRHFAGTIQENINAIKKHNSHKKNLYYLNFADAYKISQLEKDIEQFPQKINTVLGEHGITLSGGQKQRLAILKALIKPHHILVMDDFIASLDYKTSELLIKQLKEVYKQSFIISSQRLAPLIQCDHLFILDKGKIIAQGDHKTLLETSVFYQEYYNQQKSFFII